MRHYNDHHLKYEVQVYIGMEFRKTKALEGGAYEEDYGIFGYIYIYIDTPRFFTRKGLLGGSRGG